jgi:hypothetical protein
MPTVWTLRSETLDSAQASILAFANDYCIGMQGGVEIIQHDARIATNGLLFVASGEQQMSGYPTFVGRRVTPETRRIEVDAKVPSPELAYTVSLEPDGNDVVMTLSLPKSLRDVGSEAGFFSLSLYPPALWGKTFAVDGAAGVFPRDFAGKVHRDAFERTAPEPLGRGLRVDIGPEDPDLRLRVLAEVGTLELRDQRCRSDQEWFALRGGIDPARTGEVLRWRITPGRTAGWRKQPVIGIDQIGYHPDQEKRAVIELSPGSTIAGAVRLLRVDADKGTVVVREAKVEPWGSWLRYDYAVFDFTMVRDAGVYFVECEGQRAGPFRIGSDVYTEGVWQPTLHGYFPVQMCHMTVLEGGRLWHAACHLDDAMQVPSPQKHFDGYAQKEKSDSPFEPYQHIPHLDEGGWHDAGDTDLAAGAQANTTYVLALAREELGIDTDQTTVRWAERLVRMGEPDGVPDPVEQVAHGVRCLLGGHRAAGHSFAGIIDSSYQGYSQRGETSAATDNRVYDPSLAENEVDGNRSGKRDDRFAFTNHDSALEYLVMAALAAASRVLRGYDDALADEALRTAEGAWTKEQAAAPERHRMTYIPGDLETEEIRATVELLATTGAARYRERLHALEPVIIDKGMRALASAARVIDTAFDPSFKKKARAAVSEIAGAMDKRMASNPFGIAWNPHVWGVGWNLQDRAFELYHLQRAFPDLIPREWFYRILHWVLGCHAGNNVSFVSGVGARSLTTAFGINRSDFSHIPGGNASGTALIQPDFPELKTDYPYLWQQSEYVMHGAAAYVFLVAAVDRLLAEATQPTHSRKDTIT